MKRNLKSHLGWLYCQPFHFSFQYCYLIKHTWQGNKKKKKIIILKTDYWIMQFQGFDWLCFHCIWAIIPCPTSMYTIRHLLGLILRSCFARKMWQDQAIFCGCWIRDDYSQLGATRLVAYLPSCIHRALMEYQLFHERS